MMSTEFGATMIKPSVFECIHCQLPIWRHRFGDGHVGWAVEDRMHRSGRAIWRSACAFGTNHEPEALALLVIETQEDL